MSLTASDRIGGGGEGASEGRRALLLGASVTLHGILLLAMIGLGHRAALQEAAPVEIEMRFDAPQAAPALPLEAAVAAAAPAPAAEAAVPEALQPMAAPDPLAVGSAPVPALASAPPLSASSAPMQMSALPNSMAAEVPRADTAEIPRPEIAPPVPETHSETHSAPALRPPPLRAVARAMVPERRPARPVSPSEPASVAMAAPVSMSAVPHQAVTPQAVTSQAVTSQAVTSQAVTSQAGAAPVRPIAISARWQGELAGWIRARTRYPDAAKQRGEQGAVVVSFTVGRDGQVLEAMLRQRSGSETLDQAALAMFQAARVPAFPPDMAAAQVTISVPVRYRLEQ